MRDYVAYRRHLPHFQSADHTYLVTWATRQRRKLAPEMRDVVLDEIVRQHDKTAFIHVAVVMPDHVHLVMTPLLDRTGAHYLLAAVLRLVKGRSARRMNQRAATTGAVWQEEWHDHQLRGDEAIRAKCEYVAMNPVRAGLVERVEEYPWLWRSWIDLPSPMPG